MFKNILQSRWFTVLAVVIIGFFSLLIAKLEPSLEVVSKEIRNLDAKIAEVESSHLELEKLGEYLKNPSYLEREARLKLNYKKPGENVVFVYEKQYAQNPAETGDAAKPSEILPNWQKWLNYLLGK